MDLAPGDGSEAFCVCKYGYAGENCEKKVQKQSSSILESAELRKWSEKLQVPGMFELMDAIERSTEVITDHVTKVKFWTCSLQLLDKSRWRILNEQCTRLTFEHNSLFK